jgi:hypothetical protein
MLVACFVSTKKKKKTLVVKKLFLKHMPLGYKLEHAYQPRQQGFYQFRGGL